MILRPLQDRVLILPQPPVEQTASGLAVVEHRKPEQVGTVVAVGWQVHPLKARAENAAAVLMTLSRRFDGRGRSVHLSVGALLRDLVRREPVVKAGDQVLFSWQAGQEVFDHEADVRYLLMREDDLLAVIED